MRGGGGGGAGGDVGGGGGGVAGWGGGGQECVRACLCAYACVCVSMCVCMALQDACVCMLCARMCLGSHAEQAVGTAEHTNALVVGDIDAVAVDTDQHCRTHDTLVTVKQGVAGTLVAVYVEMREVAVNLGVIFVPPKIYLSAHHNCLLITIHCNASHLHVK